MPIYEYQCTACNHHFDVIQKLNDDPVKTCPLCSQDKVTRLVSAAGFQLKGSGWYATDFKNKDKTKPSTADKPSADDKSSTGTVKTEKTPVPSTGSESG